MIEVYQLLSDGSIITLGGSAQAEGEAASMVQAYPNADYHIFFGRRHIEPCDPPCLYEARDGKYER